MRRGQRSASEIDKNVHREFAHWFRNRMSFRTKIDVCIELVFNNTTNWMLYRV